MSQHFALSPDCPTVCAFRTFCASHLPPPECMHGGAFRTLQPMRREPRAAVVARRVVAGLAIYIFLAGAVLLMNVAEDSDKISGTPNTVVATR